MTSEQNVPEVQSYQGSPASSEQDGDAQYAGQPVPPGMGQSKSSRRRRRKRKNKGLDSAAQQTGFEPNSQQSGQPGGQVPSMQAGAQPQPFQQQGGQQPSHGGQNSGGKRWKKKYRDRDRQRGSQQSPGNVAESGGGYRDRDSHQPGNNAYKRSKGGKQQRGPRSFVGPMDHSYREVNGNFADAPPSTIETHGNYGGRRNGHSGGARALLNESGPIDYSVGRPIPIDENAPTKIYFFIEDLFFLAKIQETARKLGVKVAFVKNDKEVLSQLTSGDEEDRPGLIVFDLNNANAKPLTLIPKLKAKLKKGTSIIGFLSHLQGDLKAKATEAGCDTVMPRAAFSQNLPNLLRRYGTEEEEDNNFNQ
ncbi:response regulator [Edaphobacter bradus]|uniref:response regulator n=1 Tax=Edaphobacter bradus TaxID=2259016 RepID=UPI0021DF5114|nr:response regulator [Edaphobacter bradus]